MPFSLALHVQPNVIDHANAKDLGVENALNHPLNMTGTSQMPIHSLAIVVCDLHPA